MAEPSATAQFDSRPPVPVSHYERTVTRVNPGYDLVFKLTLSYLRGLHNPDQHLLVVGAGGGAEIERLLPPNPGWRITGVDPSTDMLATAREKAERLGLLDRTTLLTGSVEAVAQDARFDAAVCTFVLHFLSDADKRRVLQGIRAHLAPGGLLVATTAVRPEDGGLSDVLLAGWQEYGELMGLPHDEMAAIISRLIAQPNQTPEQDYVTMLRQAGFSQVTRFFSAAGGLVGWLAR